MQTGLVGLMNSDLRFYCVRSNQVGKLLSLTGALKYFSHPLNDQFGPLCSATLRAGAKSEEHQIRTGIDIISRREFKADSGWVHQEIKIYKERPTKALTVEI